MSLKPLIDEYYNWLKARTTIIEDETTGWTEIQTPFIGIFNDTIEIYAKKIGDKIFLSDNGQTLANLDLLGVQINRSPSRKSILDRIMLNYGLKLDNGEITTEATDRNFLQKKHGMISAIILVSRTWANFC